jgi:ribosomal protein S27AE
VTCPRCGGSYITTHDVYGEFTRCFACGGTPTVEPPVEVCKGELAAETWYNPDAQVTMGICSQCGAAGKVQRGRMVEHAHR